MPASYSDVIFAKLALQQQLTTATQVQECLNAQEAGRRAGYEQALGEVMVKRGFLTRSLYHQLDQARGLAERSRHAKLSVQLLLRHGRPGEEVLRRYYEELKADGFPRLVGSALAEDGYIGDDERGALEQALGRAWTALYQREARELSQTVRAREGQGASALTGSSSADFPPGGVAVGAASPGPGAASGSWYATGYRPAYQPPGPGGPAAQQPYVQTGMFQAYGYGGPPPGAGPAPGYGGYGGYAGGGQPAAPGYGGYGGHDGGPAGGGYGGGPTPQAPPYYATGMRAAYQPQGPDYGFGQPGSAGGAGGGGYGGPGGGRQLAPSPSPWQQQRTTNERPIADMRPPGFTGTVERAARMDLLPDWAKTQMRRSAPADLLSDDHGAGRSAGGADGATGGADAAAGGDARVPSRRQRGARRPAQMLARPNFEEAVGTVPGYEHLERLGKGKVGVVWKARELATGNIVALKVLLPVFMENDALVERFLREAKIAASLDHPNLRKVYAGGEAGGLLYLAMEYIDGETIQDKIDRHGRLPEEDVLRWMAHIARAMDHYNRKNVLHRDVKPANILVSRDDRRALLCDLGISKRVYEDYALTKQGTTLGSPWYISPEQGMGTDDLDIRSDLYSLGITVFHCMSGRVPFLGGNAGVIISKHAREALPDLKKLNPDLSPQTVELINKMCAKDPDDRPQSPKQLLAEIQWIRTEVGGGVNTPIAPMEPPGADSLEEMTPPRKKGGLWRRLLRALGLG